MSLLRKITIIIFRYIIITSVYILVKYCNYKTFTVKSGIVAGEGYFVYNNSSRNTKYISYYPIVAFKEPGNNQQFDLDTIPLPFDKYRNHMQRFGDIYFTQPPPEWHYRERSKRGQYMNYYYKNDDIANARVLSFRSYWLSESALYWLIFAGVVWTVFVDLRRIGKLEKANKSESYEDTTGESL